MNFFKLKFTGLHDFIYNEGCGKGEFTFENIT